MLLLCLVVFLGGAWAAAAGGGAVAAGLVIAAGLAAIAGAFVGGVRWLLPPALALAVGVGFVSAAGIDLDGGVGDREYRPGSAAQIRDRYELGMGELVVDLRNAELPPGDTPLELDVGVGQASLIVPRDVCVATTAAIGIGAVDVFDRDNGGVDLEWEDRPRAPANAGRLVVDAELGLGALEVSHDRRADRDGPRFDRRFDRDEGDGSASDGERTGNAACAATSSEAGAGA